MRALYEGDLSFNLLYQSPLGNAPGMLVGLLLAHLHHALLDENVRLADYRVRHTVDSLTWLAGNARSVYWSPIITYSAYCQ